MPRQSFTLTLHLQGDQPTIDAMARAHPSIPFTVQEDMVPTHVVDILLAQGDLGTDDDLLRHFAHRGRLSPEDREAWRAQQEEQRAQWQMALTRLDDLLPELTTPGHRR
jgi:hypothetical protein